MDLRGVFEPIDRVRLNVFHWRAMITTGMGVFTDGYDLSSIGIVLNLVATSLGIEGNVLWISLITGSAFIGAVLGAITFGILANRGRKTFYGVDVALLTVGALLQAFVTTPLQLFIVRLLVGFGTGADYVLSPLIMAEHSNARDRGKLLTLGFGFVWGLGATLAAAIYLALQNFVPPDMLWRIVLALGAVPAASVIYLRRKIPETARYVARIRGDAGWLSDIIREISGEEVRVDADLRDNVSYMAYLGAYWKVIAIASALWFLFDIVAYAGTLFGPTEIARSMGIYNPAMFQIIIESLFIVPGALIAAALVDRVGRKPLQTIGFTGMGLSLILFALVGMGNYMLRLFLYGLETLAAQAGPGSISAVGMLGVELAPTKIRSIAQAITVAAGRIGAAVTSFVFPYLFHTYGLSFAITFLSIVSFIAAILTMVGVPETKGKPLEEISGEVKFVK